MVIKRIGVLKLAIFEGAMMAAFGLLAAFFVMLFGAMLGSVNHNASVLGAVGGIAALIIFPIMYGVFGFIAGAIGAALYNLIAGIVGGIEIDVE
ncbi:MAG: hypothetical protein P4L92_01630 [Rudaea sp.]|nr:hypothetical protein [Rudaea sp.]